MLQIYQPQTMIEFTLGCQLVYLRAAGALGPLPRSRPPPQRAPARPKARRRREHSPGGTGVGGFWRPKGPIGMAKGPFWPSFQAGRSILAEMEGGNSQVQKVPSTRFFASLSWTKPRSTEDLKVKRGAKTQNKRRSREFPLKYQRCTGN